MKIIPFVSLAASSLPKTDAFVALTEDMPTRVARLVFSLTANNAVMFEENDQIIQLHEGGCFVRPAHSTQWSYRPHLFKSTAFEIHNPKWQHLLQKAFDAHCTPMVHIGNA